MSKRRLFLSLTTATCLTISACGAGQETGTQEPGDQETPTLDGQQLSEREGGTLKSEATPGTAAPTTAQDGQNRPAGNNPPSERNQPQGDRTTLGSSILAANLDPDAQTSLRFEARVEASSAEFPEPVVITMAGGFDVPNQSSNLEMDFSSLSSMMSTEAEEEDFFDAEAIFNEPVRVITIGDEAWVQWGFLSLLGVEEGHWLATDANTEEMFGPSDLGFGSFGTPNELLSGLEDLDATIAELGTETIHGVETRHLRATVDPSTLSTEEQIEFEELFGQLPVESLPIDFWIGDDGLLYRFAMSYTSADVGEAEEVWNVSMTFDMFDYGADLGITPPDPSLVVDEESLGLD